MTASGLPVSSCTSPPTEAAAGHPAVPVADQVRTRIWQEEPEPGQPFVTRVARCHGYDVHADLLGHATWADMLYLLFRGEAPTPIQARLLDSLALLLANPGPRDPSVHAAMAAGVGGSPAAAALMAALAVGAGRHQGARELHQALHVWCVAGQDLALWQAQLAEPAGADGIWPDGAEHPPGFSADAHGTALPVLQALQTLASLAGPDSHLAWLQRERGTLEAACGHALGLLGVAAAAFADLGFMPDEGEMLCLLLRLPGAAAHALEQKARGHKTFPFFRLELEHPHLKEAA